MFQRNYFFHYTVLVLVWFALTALSAVSLSAKSQYQTLPPLQPLTIKESEGIYELGYAVAADGDTVIVGAPGSTHQRDQDGVAFIFTSAENGWAQQATLTADDLNYSARFGSAVDISGDTAIVGAFNDKGDDDRNPGVGSAHVFVRTGTEWSRQSRLIPDTETGGWFGEAVAIDGDTAVVGARREGHPDSDSDNGVAYVFVRSGATWTQQAKLMTEPSMHFGHAVAIQGDTIVVGDFGNAVAHIFKRTGTTWTKHDTLTGDGLGGRSAFGVSLALDGDTLVIGDSWYDTGNGESQGVLYIFTQTNGSWVQQQKLAASDGAGNDNFGAAVAILGDQVAAGAWGKQVGSNSLQGAAYHFAHNGESWAEQGSWRLSDGADSDYFGNTVALYENGLFIGAPYRDSSLTDRGVVYYTKLLAQNIITFAPLPDHALSDESFTLSATASSGLPIIYTTSTPAVCSVEGNVVTLLASGQCTIIASQPGNDQVPPAIEQTHSFMVFDTILDTIHKLLLPVIQNN